MTHRARIEACLARLDADVDAERWAWDPQRQRVAATRLLGLRDEAVDARIRAFADRIPEVPGAGAHLTGPLLRRALADPSVDRALQVAAETRSLEAYAWLTPQPEELQRLVDALFRLSRSRREDPTRHWGAGAGRMERLCAYDFVQRHGRADGFDALAHVEPVGTLEQALLAQTRGAPLPQPSHADTFQPPWATTVPPQVARCPLTASWSRAVLHSDPYALGPQSGWRRDSPSPTVVLLDVRGMKQTNDRWGLLQGDAVLQALAEQLHRMVGDRSVRYSGQQWLVFHEKIPGPELAAEVVSAVADLTVPLVVEGADSETYLRFAVSAATARHEHLGEALGEVEDALERSRYGGHASVAGRNP